MKCSRFQAVCVATPTTPRFCGRRRELLPPPWSSEFFDGLKAVEPYDEDDDKVPAGRRAPPARRHSRPPTPS